MKINHLNLEYDKLHSFRKLETFFKKRECTTHISKIQKIFVKILHK